MTPTVSIIIVSWNAKRYLAECLGSIDQRACRYPMEIIVVDNASSDGSAEMIGQEFAHVRLIRNSDNLGFAKASNIGIRASSGRFAALINSDVQVGRNCITQLVEFCDAHPDVAVAGPRIIGADGRLQRSCRGFPGVWNMLCRALALDALFPRNAWFGGYLLPHCSHDQVAPVDILSGCFWLVRRQAIDAVGPLDEAFFMYGEDMDWCRRFWNAGWRIVYVPEASAVHYGGASSANAPIRFFIEKQRADLQYWRKHHSPLAVGCFLATACLHHALRAVAYAAALLLPSSETEGRRHKLRRSLSCLRWMLSGMPRVKAEALPE
jgi:GT2 family glycosyltransferase